MKPDYSPGHALDLWTLQGMQPDPVEHAITGLVGAPHLGRAFILTGL
jgi:hypothetical protein